MPLFLRALILLAGNWRAILSFAGLLLAAGFSGKIFVHELGESIGKFWWVASLACVVLLGREYIIGYFSLKRVETKKRNDEGN